MLGVQVAESVALALWQVLSGGVMPSFPSHILHAVFVYTSDFAHTDRLTLRTVVVVVSWLLLFVCPDLGWDRVNFFLLVGIVLWVLI